MLRTFQQILARFPRLNQRVGFAVDDEERADDRIQQTVRGGSRVAIDHFCGAEAISTEARLSVSRELRYTTANPSATETSFVLRLRQQTVFEALVECRGTRCEEAGRELQTPLL